MAIPFRGGLHHQYARDDLSGSDRFGVARKSRTVEVGVGKAEMNADDINPDVCRDELLAVTVSARNGGRSGGGGSSAGAADSDAGGLVSVVHRALYRVLLLRA